MKFQTGLLIALNTALISCAPLSTTPNAVPAGVKIGTIVSAGTGCAGDASWTIPSNQSTVYFATPGLKTHTNDTTRDDRSGKACQLSIPVTYPSGFQYSLQDFSLSGHQKSPAHSSALISGSSQFPGQKDVRGVGVSFPAGSEKNFTQGFGLYGVWSTCGSGNGGQETVMFQPRVSLGNSTESGEVSIKTAVVQLVWQPC